MANTPLTDAELANLSDDEIANMAEAPEMVPEAVEEPQEVAEQEPQAQAEEPVADPVPGSEEEPASVEEDPAAALAAGDDELEETPDSAQPPAAVEEGVQAEKPAEAESGDEPASPDSAEVSKETPAAEDTAAKEIDYKAAYEQIMAPFKANGTTVDLKDPSEAVQLMQMGANYTKKMQALAPHLKLVRMLENSGVTEDRLNFLIDLEKKNPAAIQKYLRDADIDPMDVDTSVEPDYTPGAHKVTDEEMSFNQTIEEVSVSDHGKELVREIDTAWDTKSKQELFQRPDMLTTLAQHKENGIYAKISAELERELLLGHFRNTPRLHAYYQVGEAMQKAGLLAPKNPTPPADPVASPTPAPAAEPRVLDQRTTPPKQKQTTADPKRVAAAAPVKGAAKTGTPADFNPLSMSDEEFEQHVGALPIG